METSITNINANNKILEMYSRINSNQSVKNYTVSSSKQDKNNPQNINTKFENQPLQDTFIKKSKNTVENKQKIKERAIQIGAGSIIFTAAAYLLKPAKSSSGIRKFARNIEFKPASTIEEAAKFAKKNWKIQEYEVTNIDVANWLNKYMTIISNKMKGVLAFPKYIAYETSENKNLIASMNSQTEKLYLNKNYFENIDKQLSDIITTQKAKYYIVHSENEPSKFIFRKIFINDKMPEINNLLNKYLTSNQDLTLIDKIELLDACESINNKTISWQIAPFNTLNQILKNETVISILKNKSIETDINKISQMDTKEQAKLLNKIFNLFKIDAFTFETPLGSSGSDLFHEFGHLQHYQNFKDKSEFFKLAKPEECEKILGKISPESKEFKESKEKQQIAARVSIYATYSPLEFVAETYAKLINNNTFTDDIMKLYEAYKGPKV